MTRREPPAAGPDLEGGPPPELVGIVVLPDVALALEASHRVIPASSEGTVSPGTPGEDRGLPERGFKPT